MVSCVGALQADDAEHEIRAIDGQAIGVTCDEDDYEPGSPDDMLRKTVEGDSSKGVGSFLDELQEDFRHDLRLENFGTEEAVEPAVCGAEQVAADSSAAASGMCEWSGACVHACAWHVCACVRT